MYRRYMKERLWLLVVVLFVSTLVTLHLGHRLPWLHNHNLVSVLKDEDRGDGSSEHLAILRDIKRISTKDEDSSINVTLTSHRFSAGHGSRLTDIGNNNSIVTNINTTDSNIYSSNNNNYYYSNIIPNKSSVVNRRRPPNTLLNDNVDLLGHKQRNLHIKDIRGEENEIDNYVSNRYKHEKAATTNKNNNNDYDLSRHWMTTIQIKTKVERQGRPPNPRLVVPGYVDTGNNSRTYRHLDQSYNTPSSPAINNNNDNNNNNNRKQSDIMTAITIILQQIENTTLYPPTSPHPLVLVQGRLSSVKQHFPLVESAFLKYKMAASFLAVDDNTQPVSDDKEETVAVSEMGSWSVLMCLNTTDGTPDGCVVSATRAGSKQFQKVNVIPRLSIPLFKACDTNISPPSLPHQDRQYSIWGKWYGGDLPCVLQTSSSPPPPSSPSPSSSSPSSSWSYRHGGRGCNESSGSWWMEENPGGQRVNYFVPCIGRHSQPRTKEESPNKTAIEIPLPSHLLTLKTSREFILWQVHVLVTSVSPLRAYLHPSGIVWDGIEAYFNRKLPRKVTLLDIHQLISDLDNEDQATRSLSWLEDNLRRSLLFMAAQTWDVGTVKSSLSRNFQLLEAVVVFNSTFHPFIIQIVPTTYVDGLSSLSKYLVEQNILEDLAAMLSSNGMVSNDVGRLLTALGMADTDQYGICLTGSDFCLSRHDLVYLLDTRREHEASRNWRRLCPSGTKPCYPGKFIYSKPRNNPDTSDDNIQHAPTPTPTHLEPISSDNPSSFPQESAGRDDKMFHSLVLEMESAFLGSEVDDNNIPSQDDQLKQENINRESPINVFHKPSIPSIRPCDNDSSSLSFLRAIHTHPRLTLHPEFSPLTTDYYTHVPHDTLLVSIRALAKHCNAVALIEDRKHARNSWVNFTLGVGENIAHVMVVGLDGPRPRWSLNTYKIRIYRRSKDSHLGDFDVKKIKHQVCGLAQDCSLPYSTTVPCGLQRLKIYKTWSHFLHRQNLSKQCDHCEGQWLVPCANCSHSDSCYWKDAVWGSALCRENILDEGLAQTCFKDRKVLFVGDSTLRGISHYLMEKINGSLLEWDKTHNIKVYTSLGEGATTVGFAYYPQFWLPVHKRPSLGVALKKLIERATPLVNSSQTILALGGVHWLARHHINILVDSLRSEGLTGIQVVIKGLGAGFHQPVNSMHHLTLKKDHEKLLSQNEAVLSYARSKGFQVVDTFNMTMARYKEFLQGKCACHFQRVTRERVSIWSKLSHTSSSSDVMTKYHVEGDVGATYSEMMINRMCGGR